MLTATGHQSLADLEAALLDGQRRQYRRLQRVAAEAAFERRHGRAAANLAELEGAFLSRTIATVDPARYLTAAEMRRALVPGALSPCESRPRYARRGRDST